MCLLFYFSFGMVATVLEMHLLDYDLSHLEIAFSFILQCGSYFFVAISSGPAFEKYDERIIMFVGSIFLTIGYLMLSPWSLIFPQDVSIVIMSLPVLGVGQALMYSN